jgi:alpha-tubulin suppressor-like RCC1 family protein
VASVLVSPSAARLGVFGTTELKATPRDERGNALTSRIVTWRSSNEGAAPVGGDGVVAGIAPGTATITATIEGVEGTAAIAVVPALGAASVAAGGYHTCGLTSAGVAYCWGDNSPGSLGDGSTTGRHSPVRVSGALAIDTLSTGAFHTCGVVGDGAVYCWGDNLDGQLAVGPLAPRTVTLPLPVVGNLRFMTVAVSRFHHTCGVATGGTAYCWGPGYAGQLGDGTRFSRSSPTPVAGSLTFTSLAAGAEHTCGVTTTGAAFCWGRGFAGEMGDGTREGKATPTRVAGGLSFASITAGQMFSCGLTAAGHGYCWGDNVFGQLGIGAAGQLSTTPAPVAGGLTFRSLAAGAWHACGVTTSGQAYCWGRDEGWLGVGTSAAQHDFPEAVARSENLVSLSAGEGHTCGVTATGVVLCWDLNHHGQLGDGTAANRGTPTEVRSP